MRMGEESVANGDVRIRHQILIVDGVVRLLGHVHVLLAALVILVLLHRIAIPGEPPHHPDGKGNALAPVPLVTRVLALVPAPALQVLTASMGGDGESTKIVSISISTVIAPSAEKEGRERRPRRRRKLVIIS